MSQTTLISPAHAENRIWNGNGNIFDEAANWTPNNVPDSADENAIFDQTGAANTTVRILDTSPFDSLIFNGATSYTLESFANLNLSGGIVNNSSADQTIIGVVLDGTGGVIQQGTGTLTLGILDAHYDGDTVINSGTLRTFNFSSQNPLGDGNLVFNGGTLGNAGSVPDIGSNLSLTADNDIIVNNDFGIDIVGSTGFVRLEGDMDLGADTRTITVTRDTSNPFNGALFLNGTISGAGGITFATNANGAEVIYGEFGSNANTYTGLTTVGAGVDLRLQKADDIIAIAGDLTIDDGGEVSLLGDNQIANTATVTVNGVLDSEFSAAETIGNLQGNGLIRGEGNPFSGTPFTLTVQRGAFSGTVADGLSPGARLALVKDTEGTLTLSGENTYSGGTTVAGGTLSLQHDRAAGTGMITTTGSVIDYGDGVTIANQIQLNSDTTQLQVLTGSAIQSGVISETGGARPLEKIGNGTLTLTAANTYSGMTTVSAGTLAVTGAGKLASSGLTVAGGTFVTDGDALLATADVMVSDGTFLVDGDETIATLTNTSTAEVGVSLAAGQTLSAGTIINGSGATFVSSGTLNGMVRNDGMFAPGSSGAVATAAVKGDFVQTSSGSLLVDVDGANGTSDLVSITGTADLAGTVDVKLTNVNPAGLFTVVSSTGGITDNGLALGDIPVFTNPLTQLKLVFPNQKDVALSFTFDTEAGSFNRNQTRILNHINAINTGSVGEVGPAILALFGLGSIEHMASALDQLSPEIVLNTETAFLSSAANFTNSLFSCPVSGGAHAVIREGNCIWLRPQGRFLDVDSTAEQIGFDERVGGVSVGGQYEVRSNWHAGFAFGYEHGDLGVNSGAKADSDRFHAGGALKYQQGPMMIAGAISGGIGAYNTTRNITFGGIGAVNEADYDIAYVGAQLRAAYLMDHAGYYAKPLVDLNLTYLDRDGFTESGNPATALTVDGGSDTYLSITPAIEVGSEHTLSAASVARTYLKAGVSFHSQDHGALTARFSGAPATAPDFQITSQLDDVFADFEAGVILLSSSDISVELGYLGRISSNTSQHGGFIKGALKL